MRYDLRTLRKRFLEACHEGFGTPDLPLAGIRIGTHR